MSRIGDLSDNQVATAIQRLKDDAQQQRSANAQTVGARNIMSYVTQTANQYDRSGTLAPPSGGSTQGFAVLVFFTAQYQPYFDAALNVRIYLDSPTNEVTVGTAGFPYLTIIPSTTLPTNNGLKMQWTVNVENTDTVQHTYYVKCQVVATDTGSLSFA